MILLMSALWRVSLTWEITGKLYNNNYDKPGTDLKLRYKRRWKFYAKNPADKPSPWKSMHGIN
jgi:hypothetical protein